MTQTVSGKAANLSDRFCAFFKGNSFFFLCGDPPPNPSPQPTPLKVVFPLGNGGVLRFQKGEGCRKEGDGGDGKKKQRRTYKKRCHL